MKILFVVLLCFSSTLFAQEVIRVEFTCVDDITGDSIYNAEIAIQIKTVKINRITTKKGFCTADLPAVDSILLTVKHGAYLEKKMILNLAKEVGKVNEFLQEIRLSTTKVQDVEGVNVYASGIPVVVYQSKIFSVSDFEVLPNGEVLVLVYPKRLEKGSELQVLSGGEIVSNFKLKENPIELIRDFRGNPHVVCEKGVYGIHKTGNEVGISTLEKEYYMRYIFPIVDTNQTKYYFSNFNPKYPAFDYMIFDQLDSSYLNIIEIKDKLMMELYRSEFKYVDVRTKLWAKNLELETGIDKEIWVGAHYFTQSLYYRELYAPMFHRNDSIFVFDYYQDKLYTFGKGGKPLDSVGIYHHYQPKQTGWKRKLLQDTETGKIYAFFEKDGICSLRSINLKTGELGKAITFQHRYIDKIAVQENQAYYIYRPFESAQKKFLYKTKLEE